MEDLDLSPVDFSFSWNRENPIKLLTRKWLNVIRHPIHNRRHRKAIPLTDHKYHPSFVLSQVGIPLEEARSITKRLLDNGAHRLLIVGCGDGASTGDWVKIGATSAIGVDLFNFGRAWQEVTTTCRTKGRQVSFIQADIERLSDHLPEAWADVIVSEAVFEHCRNLPAVLSQLRRVLRPSGILYASYGPLWYTAHGDHFSGRGGPEHSYNHLLLPPSGYATYFKDHLNAQEPAQDGGRYVPIDLFSKLTPGQYFQMFDAAGFTREKLVIEISAEGMSFMKRFPEKWMALRDKYPELNQEDLLIKGHWVWLRRDGVLDPRPA